MEGFVNDASLKLQGCVEPLFSLLDAFKSESKRSPKCSVSGSSTLLWS